MKFTSLVKASFSQGMNLFVYRAKNNTSSASKILIPLGAALLVMGGLGTAFYPLAEQLHAFGATHVILTLAIVLVSAMALFEGVYKSQDILFNCSDNNLLFSLPIPKQKIFTLRILKLLAFQLLYNMIFLLPAFAIYIYFETPDLSFYPLALLMFFLIPLAPTALAAVIGYLVRGISVHTRFQKIAQLVLTFTVFGVVFIASFSIDSISQNLASNATSINDIITRIYYPAGAFNELVQHFDILNLLSLLAFCILPLVVVIWLCSKRYFKIISKTKNHSLKKSELDFSNLKPKSRTAALVKKELNRYFSSTVYMFNTLAGIIMLVIATVAICVGGPSAIETILGSSEGLAENANDLLAFIPTGVIFLIIFTACMTSITSSSISLEGKSFNITKSLPVSPKAIFRSKILMALIISVPAMIICSGFFFVIYNFDLVYIFLTLAFAVVVSAYSALVGLIINLGHPKMDATSDTEVVKQSSSSMISSLIGMGTLFVSIIILAFCSDFATIALFGELAIFVIVDLLFWHYLATKGVKKFQNISA